MMKEVGSRYGERLADRFRECALSIPFKNESYRTQNKNN